MLIANTPPFFITRFEPVAQVVRLYTSLLKKLTLRDVLDAAWLIYCVSDSGRHI